MYEDRLTVSYNNNTLRAIGKPLTDDDLLFDFNIKKDRLEICCGDDPNWANDKFLINNNPLFDTYIYKGHFMCKAIITPSELLTNP